MAGPSGGAPRPTTQGSGGGGGSGGSPAFSTRWSDEDLRRRIRIINKIYPGMKKNPKLALSLAKQDTLDDHLAETVTKTAGFEIIQRQAKHIGKLGDDDQRRLWEEYDKTSRQLLKQAGYAGPPEAKRPSLFEQIGEAVTDAPIIRAVKDVAKGHFMDALGDIPGVGGIAAVMQGDNPLEVIGRTTGIAEALEGTTDVVGGLSDVGGQVGGQVLRSSGLEEVAGAARTISSGAEEYVAAPVLRVANVVGGSMEQMYRLNQELGKGGNVENYQNSAIAAAYEAQGKPLPPELMAPKSGLGGSASSLFQDPSGAAILGALGAAVVGGVSGDEKPVKHFVDAWERTAVGERYFNDRAVFEASNALDGDPYALETAKQLAGGSTMEDIAGKYGQPGTPKYQEEYLNLVGLTGTDEFQKAMKALSIGRVSRGQDLARIVGIPLDSPQGQVFSVATDAVIAWYSDPLLIAGKMRHAWKAAEAIQSMEGIGIAHATDLQRIESTLGAGWETAFQGGGVTYGELAKLGQRTATAAEMAKPFRQLASGAAKLEGRNALHEFFDLRFPRFQKTLGPMLDYHNQLIFEKTEALSKELGRKLTEVEAASVGGIESSKDVWNFYQTEEGLTALASGHWQPGAIGNFFLPSLSQTNMKMGTARRVFTQTVEQLAERGLNKALIGTEGMERAAAAAPAVEEGSTRLYRVQAGASLFGLSGHGRDVDPRVWYDSIERARQTGLGLGKFGQFAYIDVKDAELASGFLDITEDAFKNVAVRDMLASEDVVLNPKVLGAVGEFAEIGGEVKSTLGGVLAFPARLVQMLMARVPEGGTIDLWSPDTATQLSRLLDMEYAGAAKGQLFDMIMAAKSPTLRREMIRSVIDRIHYANGAYIDDVGREAGEKYVNGINQHYALDGLDEISMGTTRRPAGILPIADHADQIQLPDFKELARQSKRMGVLHATLGPSQLEFWDAAMGKFWKPAMLFRLGFAPRAAAEEAIVTMLRAPHVYTEGALLRIAKAGGEPVVTYRDMARRARGWEIYMPGNVASDPLMHPIDKLGHMLPNWASQRVRGMAIEALDEQTYRGAKILAENPAIQSSVAEMMAKVGSTRVNWGLPEKMLLGKTEPVPMYQIATSTEGAKALQLAREEGTRVDHPDVVTAVRGTSGYVTAGPRDPLQDGFFHTETDRSIRDPVFRAVADGRSMHVHESEADSLYGALHSKGVAGSTNYEVARAGREAVEQSSGFRANLRKYIHARGRSDMELEAEQAYLGMQRIAIDSGNHTLQAIAESARTLDDAAANVLLLDKNRVLKTLTRPEVEIDAVTHEILGPTLMTNEPAYFNRIINELPEVEPGKVRVYGRVGGPQAEVEATAAVGRTFTDLPREAMPWKYVTRDPDDIALRLNEDLTRARKGQTPHTEELFYADVGEGELLEEGGQLFLMQAHRDIPGFVKPFGTDIGTQLRDIEVWGRGADGNRARVWSELADKALAGDATAAERLGIEMGRRQIQHPNALRNMREMDRGVITSQGYEVAAPPAEGMEPVYYPVFRPSEADTAFLAVDQQSSTGRRFLEKRKDLRPNNVTAYESVGDGPLFADSTYASTDPDEVRDLITQIQTSAESAGQHITVGMAYTDIPETRLHEYYREARDAGSHDYEISMGETLMGSPLDLDGQVVITEGALRDMNQAEFIREYERLETKTWMAEKTSDPADWTPEMNAAYDAGNWQEFSRLRGYSESEIADFRDWMKLNGYEFGTKAPASEATHPAFDRQGQMFISPYGNDLPGMYQRHLELGTVPQVQMPRTIRNGVTFETAMDDAARIVNGKFDQLFMHNGRVLHELTVPGVRAGSIDPDLIFLKHPPVPERVLGPQFYVPAQENIVSTIMRRGFDAFLTPLVNAVSRNPLFINNAMRRTALAENLLRPVLSNQKLVVEAADIAEKLDLKGGVDELYSMMRGMPPKLDDVRAMVLAGEAPRGLLKLSDAEFDMVHAYRKNEEIVRKAVGESASMGALNDTIPYMDDHHVRSQFADEVRNLIPFWWAQEAFFRRWAGTIAHSPEAIRKAQLIMQGARHAGFVYKDDEGNDTFMIPGSNLIMSAINYPISKFFGGPGMLPIPVGIEGQVRLATPGFDAIGVPGFGPLIGVPLAAVRRMYPETTALETGLMGERGGGRNELEHIFPSFITGIYKALSADDSRDSTDPAVASASIQAMQYLEATGHGLKRDATVRQQQDYIDRVTNWARTMLVSRVVFGWIDPAPAQLSIGKPELSEEFTNLMQNVGIEEALAVMMERHPDATSTDIFSKKFDQKHEDISAYGTFGTKSIAGAPLEATVASQKFMEDNEEFIDKFKFASSWMLPQSNETDENVRAVRALQRELGLRDMKTPEEWYTDFKFGSAADVYFKSKEEFDLAREKLTSPKARSAADQQWKNWKDNYFDQHPVFAEEIQTRSGEKRRKTVLEEMERAFVDPKLPNFEHKKELKTLVDSYAGFTGAMQTLVGARGGDATEKRKIMQREFAAWGKEYTREHPSTLLFYQRVIFPDIDLSASERVAFDTEVTPGNTYTDHRPRYGEKVSR